MRTKTLIVMCMAGLFLPGCVSAQKRYMIAERSFTAAGKGFIEMAKEGDLDEKEIKTVDSILTQGDIYLDQWHDALDANEPYVSAEASMNWVIDSIEAFLKAKEK